MLRTINYNIFFRKLADGVPTHRTSHHASHPPIKELFEAFEVEHSPNEMQDNIV